MNLKKILVPLTAGVMALSVVACAPEGAKQSGDQSAGSTTSAAQSSADAPATGADAQSECVPSGEGLPPVDRSGEGNFPEVKGGFGEKPEIKPGSGDEPTKILSKTLVEGDGPTVCVNDELTVNYAGVLWNGKPFDSSFERGMPASFSLNQVILGWKYGLAGKKVGDRVLLAIPYEWGYGEAGSGENIPPKSTLVFVVDIIDTVNVEDISALQGAEPLEVELPKGVTVTGEPGVAPTLVYTGGEPPKEEKVYLLSKGKGPQIKPTDKIIVRIVSTLAGEETDASTWSGPEILPPDTLGMSKYTVGSRVGLHTFSQDGKTGVFAVLDITGAYTPAQ